MELEIWLGWRRHKRGNQWTWNRCFIRNRIKRNGEKFDILNENENFLRMKKFVEICFAIFFLGQLEVIQMGASGKCLLRTLIIRHIFLWWLYLTFLELFCVFFSRWLFREALRCYSCSMTTSDSSDSRCLSDPISVDGQSVVNCNKKYCTILRQELKVTNIIRDIFNMIRDASLDSLRLDSWVSWVEVYQIPTLNLSAASNDIII